jgi:uncharacterized protein (DUF58 family)
MLSVPAERLQTWAANWARRRQGDDGHTVILKRRRIYILPTRFGIVYGGVLFAMLLGSLNYGANLGFAMTFLLAGLGLVVMYHCHNNLLAIIVRFSGADAVFAGSHARFHLTLESGLPVPRFDLLAECANVADGPVDLPAAGSAAITLHVPTRQRGWTALPRVCISTRFPGNLFRAWTWIHMDVRCLVYPQPALPGRPFPPGAAEFGARTGAALADDDFVGLREATPTDSPRRIAWKIYARSSQLLVKQFAGGAEKPCLFRFDDLPGLDTEARLAQLTRWCIDAAESGRSYGIELPDLRIPLSQGERHLHQCLEALALHGLPQ